MSAGGLITSRAIRTCTRWNTMTRMQAPIRSDPFRTGAVCTGKRLRPAVLPARRNRPPGGAGREQAGRCCLRLYGPEAVSGAEQVTLFQAEIDGQTVTYSLIFTDSAPEDFVQALRSYLSGVTQPEWTGAMLQSVSQSPQSVSLLPVSIGLGLTVCLLLAALTLSVRRFRRQLRQLNAFVPLIRKPVWIPWNTCSAVFLPLFMTKTVCFTMLFIFIWISDTSSGSEGTWPPLQCGATRLPFSGHVSVPAALLLRRQMLVLLP